MGQKDTEDRKGSILGVFLQPFGEYLILLLFVVLYIAHVSIYFWTLPVPSDPLQYLGPAVQGTTYGYWPWLDRINLAIHLRLFSLIFSGRPETGTFYIAFINSAILIIAMLWALRKSGFWAALFMGIFVNSSYLMLGYSTYLYPDQTVALYSLLSFGIFFSNSKTTYQLKSVLFCGFFAAFAMFSKVTGLSVFFFFIFYLTYHKDWRGLKHFIIGVIGGTLFLVVAFCLLYNVNSFFNASYLFFKDSIKVNLMTAHPRACTYQDVLLSASYFSFLALFIAIGAYRHAVVKHLFVLSGLSLALVYLIRFKGPPIPNYLYPAYVLSTLGLAVYLADILKQKSSRSFFENTYVKLVFSLLFLLLLFIGVAKGLKYEPQGSGYRVVIIMLYAYMPLIIIGLLTFIEFSKSSNATIVFVFFVASFISFLNGGLAFRKVKLDRIEAKAYYDLAPLLNEIEGKKFSIFLSDWDGIDVPKRLLLVYGLFFDKKYGKSTGFEAISKYDKLINESVKLITEKKDLKKAMGAQILTDDPYTLLSFYPGARKIKELFWDGRKLFIFQCSEAFVEPTLSWTQYRLLSFIESRVNDGVVTTAAFHTNNSRIGAFLKLDCGERNNKVVTKKFIGLEISTFAKPVNAIWNIQYSDDDENWITVYENAGGIPLSVGTYVYKWEDAGAHRYWRLYKINGGGTGGYHSEIRFFE